MRFSRQMASGMAAMMTAAIVNCGCGTLMAYAEDVGYEPAYGAYEAQALYQTEKAEAEESKNPVISKLYQEFFDMNEATANIYAAKSNVLDEDKLWDMCKKAASEYDNVKPEILFGLVMQESRAHGNINEEYPNAQAYGICQIIPEQHKERIELLGYSPEDLKTNHQASLDVAANYLSELENKCGDLYKALVAYNMGPTKAEQKFAENRSFVWGYTENVLEMGFEAKDAFLDKEKGRSQKIGNAVSKTKNIIEETIGTPDEYVDV